MNHVPLTPEELSTAQASLPEWTVLQNSLTRSIHFPSFLEALKFMTLVGLEADALNHHPEWTNLYNRVDIRLTTHSAGNQTTALDLELARRINAYLTEWRVD